MSIANNILRSIVADARGSVKTIGDLIAVEAAVLKLSSADRLARRQAVKELMDRFGWKHTGWITKKVIMVV